MAGAAQTILHWNAEGGSAVFAVAPGDGGVSYQDLALGAGDEVWLVGAEGTRPVIHRLADAGLEEAALSTSIGTGYRRICYAAPDSIRAFGNGGGALYFDGGVWVQASVESQAEPAGCAFLLDAGYLLGLTSGGLLLHP